MSGIEVRPLTPARAGDFFAFFDRDAFTDNPRWSGCFCTHYEMPGDYTIPDAGTPEFATFHAENRALKAERIGAGQARGYLAYRAGKVVGWLNAQAKESYPNPRDFGSAFADAPDGTGILMCFVVSPDGRGQGVGTALLRAACDGFAAKGLRYAQGFARRPDAPLPGWMTFTTGNYHGTLSMYLENGFREVATLAGFAVMRRDL